MIRLDLNLFKLYLGNDIIYENIAKAAQKSSFSFVLNRARFQGRQRLLFLYTINYIIFRFEVAGDPARHVYDPLLILIYKAIKFSENFV